MKVLLAASLAGSLLLAAPAAIAQTAEPSPSSAPLAVPPAPAGRIPAEVTLDVTGAPAADPSFLEGAIRSAIEREIRPTLRPGASLRFGAIVPWPLLPLASGTRGAVDVNVSIVGDDPATTVTGMVPVTLNGVVLPAFAPDALFLSDDPEYLRSEGLVFRNGVPPGRSARLYYYHSDVGIPRDLDVVLTVAAPSRVQLVASQAGPELDVMNVGHAVTRDVLRFEQAGESAVVDLQPGRPFVVRHGLLLQGEVVAGAVDVHVIGGAPVDVAVIAALAGSRPDTYLGGPRVPFDGHRRHGVFALAGYGETAQTFTVGGAPAVVQYGAKNPTPRNVNPADDGHDYGDYGVVHRFTFGLVNPTDEPRTVYLYERPMGGPVRSTFVVDGQFKEIGCARLPLPYVVATYQVPPHGSGSSSTTTMTDGGSFYPLEYGVTDLPPAPYPPPVGSPDGCSPVTPAFPDASAGTSFGKHA